MSEIPGNAESKEQWEKRRDGLFAKAAAAEDPNLRSFILGNVLADAARRIGDEEGIEQFTSMAIDGFGLEDFD